MDTLKKLNALGTLQNTPTKRISELNVDQEYPVIEIKQLLTKHGNKILTTLIDNDYDEFQIFLPDRFSKSISDKELKMLNKIQNLKLIYKGTKDCGKGNPAHLIEFLS